MMYCKERYMENLLKESLEDVIMGSMADINQKPEVEKTWEQGYTPVVVSLHYKR